VGGWVGGCVRACVRACVRVCVCVCVCALGGGSLCLPCRAWSACAYRGRCPCQAASSTQSEQPLPDVLQPPRWSTVVASITPRLTVCAACLLPIPLLPLSSVRVLLLTRTTNKQSTHRCNHWLQSHQACRLFCAPVAVPFIPCSLQVLLLMHTTAVTAQASVPLQQCGLRAVPLSQPLTS
jgi:hypothetical protein